MRLLRFNESSKIRMYSRGEVLIFLNKKYSFDTVKEIVESIHPELEVIDLMYNGDCILVKTPIGKEIESAQTLIKSIPKIFNSFERRDMNQDNISNEIDEISDIIINLEQYLGKNIIDDDFNKDIDLAIDRLQKLKIK